MAELIGPRRAPTPTSTPAGGLPERAPSPAFAGPTSAAVRPNHATMPESVRTRLPAAIHASLGGFGAPLREADAMSLRVALSVAHRERRDGTAADSEVEADRVGREAAAEGPKPPAEAGSLPALDPVRIHADTTTARAATAASARAFTVGRDIVFGPGQYSPDTEVGQAIIGHELFHASLGGSPLAVRRAGMPFDPAAIALQLRAAMEGLGTDELTIYAALAGRDQAQDDAIAAAYLRLTGRTLSADLQDELSSGELLTLAAVAPEASPTPEAKAMAVAMRLRDAMEGLGTNEAAIYVALSGRSETELDAIKQAYRQMTGTELESEIRDEMSGDELQQAFGAMGLAATIDQYETELGGLGVGNFDFHFRDGKVLVQVLLKFEFTDDITAVQRSAFKARFLSAVNGRWGNTGWHLEGGPACPTPDVPIEIRAQEMTGSFYHKVVDVENRTSAQRRENVMRDINVNLWTDDFTLTHEFGHVLGLYDEYVGPWIENIMWWHRNVPSDPMALMVMDTTASIEMRARYFEHYRRRVQATAPPGCEYRVASPKPPGPGPTPGPTPGTSPGPTPGTPPGPAPAGP